VAPLDSQLLPRVWSFFEHLFFAVIVVDPCGTIVQANGAARILFGRKPRGPAERLLGDELYRTLCVPLLTHECKHLLWRELQLPNQSSLTVSASSVGIEHPGGEVGALLMFVDVSAEIALHAHYRQSLEQQRRRNEELEREIAIRLREHEDDLAQFAELLQIAPAVFGAFEAEAQAALGLMESWISKRSASVDEVLRAAHTLKGNARSLGLNFIGGRAHSVEQLVLESATEAADPLDERLPELTRDLERALKRAHFLRTRLDSVAREFKPGHQFEHAEQLEELLGLLQGAQARLENDAAGEHLSRAIHLLETQARIPIESLVEFVRMTAHLVARSNGIECDVEFHGDSMTLAPSSYRALSVALPHLTRNAILHGIEPPEERIRAGKPAAGVIELQAQEVSGELRVWLRDDGRGLDIEALRARGEALGARCEDPEDVMALLFHPNLTTSDEATLDAGRGYGGNSAKAVIEALGGSIAVRARSPVGTELLMVLPASPQRASPEPCSRAPRTGPA
jgi:chemotaxis protein histidine kinase CheA